LLPDFLASRKFALASKNFAGFNFRARPARFPSEWNHSLDKKSQKLKKLERVLFTRRIPCEPNAL
jgi:hypothetical protein